jgi:hypothetical protein
MRDVDELRGRWRVSRTVAKTRYGRWVSVPPALFAAVRHLAGVPWATIGQNVGQRDLAVTANTYSHVLADETELDHRNLLG